MTSTQVYLLPLNDDGSPDVAREYIYIAPSSSKDPVALRFAIEGTSSICRHGSLWVNVPEKGQEFRRNSFREFKYVFFAFVRSLEKLCVCYILADYFTG